MKGQKTVIIARNGTGKSTLLNIIAGTDLRWASCETERWVHCLFTANRLSPEHFSVIDAILKRKHLLLTLLRGTKSRF